MVTRYQKCKCPSGRHLVQAFPRELINGAIGYVTELKQLSRRKSDRGFEDGKHIIITMLKEALKEINHVCKKEKQKPRQSL